MEIWHIPLLFSLSGKRPPDMDDSQETIVRMSQMFSF